MWQAHEAAQDHLGAEGRCLQVTQHKGLGSSGKMLQRLIEMRAPFLDPINILQVGCRALHPAPLDRSSVFTRHVHRGGRAGLCDLACLRLAAVLLLEHHLQQWLDSGRSDR